MSEPGGICVSSAVRDPVRDKLAFRFEDLGEVSAKSGLSSRQGERGPMPAERVSMRRVREILRLKFECGRSDRAIAVAVSVARSTVQLCLARFAAAGLSWPLPATLTERGLEALLFAPLGGSTPGKRLKAEPDWAVVHRELRRPGVTLLLLWEEYRTAHQGGGYGYSRWCELYRSWEARLSPTMRQVHPAGERLFVDYAG